MIGLDPNVLRNGTSLVRTEVLGILLDMTPIVFPAGGIVALDGPAGCGKTTALTALATSLDTPVTSVSLDPRSTDKDVIKLLHSAVSGRPASAKLLRTDMLAELRVSLAGAERVIIVDEAQNAGIAALEMIRTLHMDPTASWNLVLSGADLDKRLTAERMLRSRVMHWARFAPLASEALHAVLAGLHPLLAQLDPDLVAAADRAACHGVLREWVKVLVVLQALADRGGTVGRVLLQQALQATTGREVRLPR